MKLTLALAAKLGLAVTVALLAVLAVLPAAGQDNLAALGQDNAASGPDYRAEPLAQAEAVAQAVPDGSATPAVTGTSAATAVKPAKVAKPKAEKKPATPNWRQMEADLQAHNAARVDRGGRVTAELLGPKAGKDRSTSPQAVADGNPHSRAVFWQPPYKYHIQLVDKITVTEINFICDDLPSEEAVKDIEIILPDGTVIKQTLEVIRPTKDNRARQTVKIGQEVAWIDVKVLSHYPSPPKADGSPGITFGGLGEIEVITTADLGQYMVVPDYNAAAAVYLDNASPRSDYSGVKVTMPPAIKLGERPGIYLTRDEIVKLREVMKATPRGQGPLARVVGLANSAVDKPVVMPDPKIPAQLKDRGDAQSSRHGVLSRNAGALGWAYQFTDDERYAAKAREILVGYAKLYPNDYAEHKGVNANDSAKVMAQRLSEAMWLLPLIQSYDCIYNAKCLTDEDRKLIENDLIRTAVTFINGKRPAETEVANRTKADPAWRTADPKPGKGAVGNWVNFYNAAFIQAGIVLGDQNWIDLGAADSRMMIFRGIGDDGMWGEGAIGYQLFARMALVACLEPLARHGIDVYSFNNCRAKNLWDSPLKYAYPDGTSPGIHDSGRASVAGDWQAMAYDFAWLRYQDPNYGKLVNDAPRQINQSEGCYFPTVIYDKLPETPLAGLGSMIFNNLGYGILRGRDVGGPTFLLCDYGPYAGPHDHPDKLNLIMFADGDELAGEPQMYRYEDARHGEWTTATIAHWTMTVDQSGQMQGKDTEGKLLVFHDAETMKVMRATCATAYPGVGLDRTVVQMPGYVADVYRGWGKTAHKFDYPLCFRGQLDALKDAQPEALKALAPATVKGYRHINVLDPAGTKAAGNWSGLWDRPAAAAVAEVKEADVKDADGKVTAGKVTTPAAKAVLANQVRAYVAADPQTTVFTGRNVDGRDMAIFRQEGTAAVFVAVIDPFKESDAVKFIEPLKVDGPVAAYGLKVTRSDGGTDLIVVRYDQQPDGQPSAASSFAAGAANGQTNALVTVVRLNAKGEGVKLMVCGGTAASCGPLTIALDKPGNAEK